MQELIEDKRVNLGPYGRFEELRLSYVEQRSQDLPEILWIHGMGSYRWVFRPLLESPPMAAHHYAIDLPGFGDSPALPTRQRIEDYVDAVVGFMEMLRSHPILVGHSFGGMVAGEVMARRPDLVSGLVLISSAGIIPPQGALDPTPYEWINRLGIWITGIDWFGTRMMRSLGVSPESLSRETRSEFRYGWRHAREMARMGHFYETPDLALRLGAVERPIVAIHGTRDALFPYSDMIRAIGDAFLIRSVEGAGHVPFYSHFEVFRDVMRDVLLMIQSGDDPA